MKILGKVWKEYLASWPEGQYYDEHDMLVDGGENDDDCPKDDAVVTFSSGVVYGSDRDFEGTPLVRHFNKWRKSLDFETHFVAVPKSKADEFREFVKLCGAKFVG